MLSRVQPPVSNNLLAQDVNRKLIGVYVGVMYIYLITCHANNKLYVGRTERKDPNFRWNEYRSVATRPSGAKENRPIVNAMRKHRFENFSFEIIEKVSSRDLLPEREAHWIRHYDCLSPKGYNLETYQANRRVTTPEMSLHMSVALQGVKKGSTSIFRGVTKVGNRFNVEIRKQRVRLGRWFNDEREAAKAYDYLALHLYGSEAEVNFPESRLATPEDWLKTYEYFNKDTSTSRYIGVHWSSTSQCWATDTGNIKAGKHGRRKFKDETQAAETYDKSRLYWFGKDFSGALNFPEKREQYLTENLKEMFDRDPPKRPAPNIKYRMTKNGYRASLCLGVWRLQTIGLPTQEAAQQALDQMKTLLNIA